MYLKGARRRAGEVEETRIRAGKTDITFYPYHKLVSYLLPSHVIIWLHLDYNLLKIGTCLFLFPYNGRYLIHVCLLVMKDETCQVVGDENMQDLEIGQKNLVIS